MLRIDVSENHLDRRICVHVEDYLAKPRKVGDEYLSGDYLSASVYTQYPMTDETMARLVLVVRKMQNQLDAIIPGLFSPVPDDEAADAMRILGLANELDRA